MTSSRADLDALRWLAARFQMRADGLAERMAAFHERANLAPGAFGGLPEGRRAWAGYTDRLETATNSLYQLQATLRQFAENVDATATNWERADESSVLGSL